MKRKVAARLGEPTAAMVLANATKVSTNGKGSAVPRADELRWFYATQFLNHVSGHQLAEALDLPEHDGHLLAQLSPATRARLRIDGNDGDSLKIGQCYVRHLGLGPFRAKQSDQA